MYETDNFAHIVGEIQRRKDEAQRQRERWAEWDEAQRRSLPWCWAISLVFLVGLAVLCYFNP